MKKHILENTQALSEKFSNKVYELAREQISKQHISITTTYVEITNAWSSDDEAYQCLIGRKRDDGFVKIRAANVAELKRVCKRIENLTLPLSSEEQDFLYRHLLIVI